MKPNVVATLPHSAKQALRVALHRDKRGLELRVMSPLAAGAMSPTKEGLVIPLDAVPALIAVLQSVQVQENVS